MVTISAPRDRPRRPAEIFCFCLGPASASSPEDSSPRLPALRRGPAVRKRRLAGADMMFLSPRVWTSASSSPSVTSEDMSTLVLFLFLCTRMPLPGFWGGADRALLRGGVGVDLLTLETAEVGGASDEKLPVIALLTLLRKLTRRAAADMV